MVLVSACLWGEHTRYDGKNSLCMELKRQLAQEPVLALCPEVMGGLSVPRPPAHFVNAAFGREGEDLLNGHARMLDAQGHDVSEAFIAGARQVLAMALAHGVKRAYLKDRSPSCGYDPNGLNPNGGPGLGVLSALLRANDIHVIEVRMQNKGV